MSGGDPSNPIHLEGLRDSAIQQGVPPEDIEVGYATDQEVVDSIAQNDVIESILIDGDLNLTPEVQGQIDSWNDILG